MKLLRHLRTLRLLSLTALCPLMLCMTALYCVCAFGAQNVVLIVADDLGRDLGCYGNSDVQTPNLDRLANQATRFEHAYCTTASCSASRSVLLTGRYNHANGQYGHQHGYSNFHTADETRSLPVRLSAAGYRTACIGKLHVQPTSVYAFDVLHPSGPVGNRDVAGMAKQAQEFIRDGERPFFLYFCPGDPHRAAKGFANERWPPGTQPVQYDPARLAVPPFLPDAPETRHELAEYYAAVSRLDQGVGLLMDVLRDTGHERDTLVIFLSDNGMPFPGAKTTLYDPGCRLPLIVRTPGVASEGVVSEAMVNWADVAPTVLDWAGVRCEVGAMQGRSFLDALGRPAATTTPARDEVFLSHTFHEVTNYYPMRGIRTRQYKLLANLAHPLPFPFAADLYQAPTWQASLARGDTMYGARSVAAYVHRPHVELYDVLADPNEVHNLAGKPELAEVEKELTDKVRAFQQRTKDPWLHKWTYE